METAIRFFEFFMFNGDVENTALATLIIYMLLICEAEILELDSDDCFRFVGHGKFIEACFTNPNYFK